MYELWGVMGLVGSVSRITVLWGKVLVGVGV